MLLSPLPQVNVRIEQVCGRRPAAGVRIALVDLEDGRRQHAPSWLDSGGW
jgi:hypothetical protein